MNRLGFVGNLASRLYLRPRMFGFALVAAASFGGSPASANSTSPHHKSDVVRHVASREHEGQHSARLRLAETPSHRRVSVAEYARAHQRYAEGHERYGRNSRRYRYASARYRHSGLQCVPYAREVSHIELSGDAFLWWAEAAGRYARGDAPVEGAVLNFRPIRRMPLGHVAVVTAVIDSRTILVTQANWVRGTITNDVTVQDVSPANDWSQVEVELGDSSRWGAPYPAYGFIYNHPDTGITVASAANPAGEVAEAPPAAPLPAEAPDRNLQ